MNYSLIIPLSVIGILVAFITSCIILILVIFIKRLHTITHLLICNGCISSLFYCIEQYINYSFLSLIPWETSDISCRLRGYFGYMSVAAVIYSYLAQATSRLFISILSTRYRWIASFKTHIILILIQWIIVFLVPLPAIITKDIKYYPSALCWVPKNYTLHIVYTGLAYYLLPVALIFTIYAYIYYSIQHPRHRTFTITRSHSNRDLVTLRNIVILLSIYTVGAIPIVLFLFIDIPLLYEIGVVSTSLTVAAEKIVVLILDRALRSVIRAFFHRSMSQIRPIS